MQPTCGGAPRVRAEDVVRRGGTKVRNLALRAAVFSILALGLAVVAPSAAVAAGGTGYATATSVCPPAAPGHVTCFAMVLRRAKRTTPGAHAYRLAAGATGIGPAGGLTPTDLATAYSLGSAPSTAGSTQTVGIVDWGNDPELSSNLNTFDTKYGLPTCTTANGCLKVVNQTGGTTLPGDQGSSVEISLDVQAVHAICQKCKIDLVEASASSFADTEAAEDEAVKLGATEISNSYGGPDKSGVSSTDEAAYNHPGVVITVSAGDSGFYNFDQWIETPSGGPPANSSAPNFPAELSTVVSVGGTSLLLNQNGTRQSEYVWNDNGAKDQNELALGSARGASGGGCSLFIAAKGWQTALPDWAQTACAGKRLSNDVSAVADPYTGFDIYDTDTDNNPTPGWQTIGGTSLSSPLVAAMYALSGGAQGISYPALTLYGHLGSSSLYDVTVGGNGFCGGEGAAECSIETSTGPIQNPNTLAYNGVALGILDCAYPASGTTPSAGDLACDAGNGYDGPSGVGAPAGLGSFTAVRPSATISGLSSIAALTSGTWTATARDPFPGGSVTKYSWNWGDGTAATVTTTDSAAHTYTTGGVSRTITLTMTDNYGVTGTATHAVSVTAAASPSTLRASKSRVRHGSRHTTIRFTYTAARSMSDGAVSLIVPSGWSAPVTRTRGAGYAATSSGRITVSGRRITISGLTLVEGQAVTITYGSRAHGGSGATAPRRAVGFQTWRAGQKSTSAGTLTRLAAPPKIRIS